MKLQVPLAASTVPMAALPSKTVTTLIASATPVSVGRARLASSTVNVGADGTAVSMVTVWVATSLMTLATLLADTDSA